MNIKNINKVFFLGIGGIGMSAIARYFASQGISVLGYDKTPSPMTDSLKAEGIEVYFEDNLDVLTDDIDLVVYTPAIPKSNAFYHYFLQEDFEMMKRAEVLGLISKDKFTVAIAGTHGKTSVSAQVTHLLKESAYGCTGFVGGVCRNYDSNYVEGRKDVVVVEADEFDRSFLHLSPDILVITSLDPDHLDIYGDFDEMKKTFLQLISKVKPYGKVLLHEDVMAVLKKANIDRFSSIDIYTYGQGEVDFAAEKVQVVNMEDGDRKYKFEFFKRDEDLGTVHINIPGQHNVDNTLASISVTQLIGLDLDLVRKGIETFEGIKRRFDFHVKMNQGKAIYIDDYAHHPSEIKVTVDAIRNLYPNKKLTVAFQPHLFTRTQDFVDDFALELAKVDELLLLPIYPARELPIDGVTSEWLLDKIQLEKKQIIDRGEILNWLENNETDVFLTIGAGDIDRIIGDVKAVLTNA